jgi:hypothetical protein
MDSLVTLLQLIWPSWIAQAQPKNGRCSDAFRRTTAAYNEK